MENQLEILTLHNSLNGESETSRQSRLAEKLMSVMRDKRVEKGTRLPSIRAICRHFKAGHAMVQQTLNELESRGYVSKRHGKGCFVKRKPDFKSRPLSRRVSVPLMSIPYASDYPRPQANIIAGISVGLGVAGWTFQSVPCRSDGGEFEDILRSYCNNLTDGVLLPGAIPNMAEHIRGAKIQGMPVMLINKLFDEASCFTLSVGAACEAAYRELRGDGAEKLIVFRGTSLNPRFYELDESLAALLGMELEVFRSDSVSLFSPERRHLSAISAEMVEVLKGRRERPDAIFCSPEILTLAAANALKKLNWSDVRLVSVDDSPEVGHYSGNGFLHIQTPYFQLGKAAAEEFAATLEKGMLPHSGRSSVECVFDEDSI